MSGTDMGYAAMDCTAIWVSLGGSNSSTISGGGENEEKKKGKGKKGGKKKGKKGSTPPMVLRVSYAMSSTGIGHAMVLRCCYAMSGTDIGRATPRREGRAGNCLGNVLRVCCAMSSTELGYAATRLLCTVRCWCRLCYYAFAMRCPVLTCAMLLPGIREECVVSAQGPVSCPAESMQLTPVCVRFCTSMPLYAIDFAPFFRLKEASLNPAPRSRAPYCPTHLA
eukprot:3941672-Rhodomonas_salina.1